MHQYASNSPKNLGHTSFCAPIRPLLGHMVNLAGQQLHLGIAAVRAHDTIATKNSLAMKLLEDT